MRGHGERAVVHNPKREGLTRHRPCCHIDLGLPRLQDCEKKTLELFKPLVYGILLQPLEWSKTKWLMGNEWKKLEVKQSYLIIAGVMLGHGPQLASGTGLRDMLSQNLIDAGIDLGSQETKKKEAKLKKGDVDMVLERQEGPKDEAVVDSK